MLALVFPIMAHIAICGHSISVWKTFKFWPYFRCSVKDNQTKDTPTLAKLWRMDVDIEDKRVSPVFPVWLLTTLTFCSIYTAVIGRLQRNLTECMYVYSFFRSQNRHSICR